MRRYWVPEISLQGDFFKLEEDVFHHIFIVCRQSLGSRFEVIVNSKAYFVEVVDVYKKNAVAKIIEERPIPELSKPHIHLALSLPKFQTLEKVIEKSVELGVHSLHLFHSDFSFMRPKSGELDKKMQRWEKIITGATQQTGRGERMQLTEVEPLDVLLARFSESRQSKGFLAYEGDGKMSLRESLSAVDSEAENIWIFVGAEGGFSEKDLEMFKNYKLLPISLGDQVLRVETACVTIVSILKYGLGHFD